MKLNNEYAIDWFITVDSCESHVVSNDRHIEYFFNSLSNNRENTKGPHHYCDVTTGRVASQITSLTIVNSTVYSDADQRKHQSSAPWIPRKNGQ